jgi:hypothetical protein
VKKEATLACVLRSGGSVFTPRWVLALARGVREYLPKAGPLVCLTDLRFRILGVETVPLLHGWPGWWSKVELFRPDVFDGPVLYLDLDSLPVGDLSDLASYRGDLAALSDFYTPKSIASGVLAFTPSDRTAAVYDRMKANSSRIMRANPGRSDGFYRSAFGSEVERIQDLYPRQVVSYKVHARGGAPKGARLVCGHGKPRFSNRSAGWANRLWKERTR